MKILCVTSLSWIRNIVKSFKRGKKIFATVTSATTIASVNLWRKYDKQSIRRNVDVFCARCTCVYYTLFSIREHKINKGLIYRTSLASLFYNLSVMELLHFVPWHVAFHLTVYDIQRELIKQ